jgi:hypothetical protein
MLRNLMPWLSSFALLAVPAIAHAEEPTKSYPDCGREPTDAEVAAAKGAFQAGNASFNEADYARAIDYWEDAYRRDCTANPLLLNLARAYELAGRKRQAVVALETFLAREPGTGEKDQINRRIEVLKKKIAEEDAAAAAAPPPTTTTTPPPPTTTTTEPMPGSSAPHRSVWPYVTMGAGVVLVGVGGLTYFTARKKADDLSQTCTPPGNRNNCPPGTVDQGDKENQKMALGSVLAGVGGAAIVGGAIWWYLDKRAFDKANAGQGAWLTDKPRLIPLVGPQVAGVGMVGAF